jgi:anthranilate synthase/aminodeoxychorismate synthase-like glutamine amidotransferase
MILLIDNYDSFVFNLARYLEELGQETAVVRHDAATVAEIAARRPQAIVISPGPCTPHEAGVSVDVLRELSGEIPMLGVCLGHQALAAAFGGNIIRAPEPVHGRTSLIQHSGEGLFRDLPTPLRATRYHSLIVEESSLPEELIVTARSEDGLIMGLAHRSRPCFGVQFHPESVLTQSGHQLLANFLRLAGLNASAVPAGDWQPPPPSNPELPPLLYPVPYGGK